MSAAPDDEQRHEAGPEPLWGESWYFDFAAPDGSFGGYVRLGLYPHLGVSWWWAYLVGEGRRPVLVRDHDAPLPGPAGLELRTEGLWAEVVCDAPHEQWSIGMEAFGVALDDPADAYRGERGERVPVALDLEWGAVAPVYDYTLTTRYEQACHVRGQVRIGDETIEVDAPGERDHSWGVRDWWSFPWVWTAGRLADGTTFHAAGTQLDGQALWSAGFVVPPVGELGGIERFMVVSTLGDDGIPRTARFDLDDTALDVEVLHPAPLALAAPDGRIGRFPRCLCRFRSAGGAEGYGWVEWNQPPQP